MIGLMIGDSNANGFRTGMEREWGPTLEPTSFAVSPVPSCGPAPLDVPPALSGTPSARRMTRVRRFLFYRCGPETRKGAPCQLRVEWTGWRPRGARPKACGNVLPFAAQGVLRGVQPLGFRTGLEDAPHDNCLVLPRHESPPLPPVGAPVGRRPAVPQPASHAGPHPHPHPHRVHLPLQVPMRPIIPIVNSPRGVSIWGAGSVELTISMPCFRNMCRRREKSSCPSSGGRTARPRRCRGPQLGRLLEPLDPRPV